MLVRVALDIAASDGEVAPAVLALVARIASDLGMSLAHVRGIIHAGSDDEEAGETRDEFSSRP